jgi:phage terminase large subunit GpA-like protein
MIAFGREMAATRAKRVVIVTAAQSGKTDTFLDIIGARLDQRPVPILYAGPTKEFVIDQFEPRLMALLDEAPTLKAKVARGKKNKKTIKWVAGVKVRLAHAGSSSALKSDPFGLALVDEYDEMLADVKGQGDPLGLIEARGATYADFITGIASTPSLGSVEVEEHSGGLDFWKISETSEIESGIWKLWQEGTRYHWCWPCPHCEDYFVPRFRLMRWPDRCTPAQGKREAFMACPHCGGVIENAHKERMNERGAFVAPGQTIDSDGVKSGDPPDSSTISFWVSGLASPFVSFGDRVEGYLLALQSGEQEKIQTAINAGFGECFAQGGGDAPEWQEVANCKTAYASRELPSEAVFLTCGVDVQKTRLVYVIRAWGARQESWLIEHGEIWGDTHLDPVWLDLDEMLSTPIEGMMIRRAFIDSGFKPDGADEVIADHKVYEFCRRHARLAFATKGYGSRATPLSVSRIDVSAKGRKATYGLDLVLLDSDFMKSWVHQRVRWPDDQRGGWHLPADATEEYCRQIASEARIRKPNGRYEWVRRQRANHFLDCEALAYAAAYMIGVQKLGDGPRKGAPPPSPPGEDQHAPRSVLPAAPPIPTGGPADRMAAWAARFNG